MELGEKLRLARIEAGLSQRQLCGEVITRNMLSQIEHGTATPSMGTLRYLAGRLGKSVSYFLEEEVVLSPNQQIMASARRYYDAGDYRQAAAKLASYRRPDPIFDRECALLQALTDLELAEQALNDGREIYARELLQKTPTDIPYCRQELTRRRLLLLGRLRDRPVSRELPSLDGELLLRAQEALAARNSARAGALLDAAEDQSDPRWAMLRGESHLASGRWEDAARCFRMGEAAFPRRAAAYLEQCYRELGDYRLAYEYACKQRT